MKDPNIDAATRICGKRASKKDGFIIWMWRDQQQPISLPSIAQFMQHVFLPLSRFNRTCSYLHDHFVQSLRECHLRLPAQFFLGLRAADERRNDIADAGGRIDDLRRELLGNHPGQLPDRDILSGDDVIDAPMPPRLQGCDKRTPNIAAMCKLSRLQAISLDGNWLPYTCLA